MVLKQYFVHYRNINVRIIWPILDHISINKADISITVLMLAFSFFETNFNFL